MFEKEIEALNDAYKSYNLNYNKARENEILDYIRSRIVDEQSSLEYIIEQMDEKYSFDDILTTFDEQARKKIIYKRETHLSENKFKFYYGKMTTSVGNIAVECSDTLEVLRYFIRAIQSHNTITISDIEYSEVSVKAALLVIFCEALEKFQIDMNLIMLLPCEECYYDEFDKVLVYDENGLTVTKKAHNYSMFIYIEDAYFESVVENEIGVLEINNKKYRTIRGDFYDVISEINKEVPAGAVIYTQSSVKAYEFMNLVHSSNVFVNTTLMAKEDIEEPDNELYCIRKIMYPSKDAVQTTNNRALEDKKMVAETALVIQKPNPWYKKIVEKIKGLFKKN